MPVPMFTVNHDGVKLVIRSSQCHPVVHTSRAECLDLDAILRGILSRPGSLTLHVAEQGVVRQLEPHHEQNRGASS